VRNVSECTRLNGYFIGTCYDGKTVFDILSKQNSKILITTKVNQKKILEITQKYSQTAFTETEPCLGYEIDVWQESINQTFSEYLVNFEYLKKIMMNYGFELVTVEVAQQMGLPKATGLFKDLFDSMCKSNKKKSNIKDYGSAANMTEEEKKISFMNRFFVFQKKRNVEANLVQKNMEEELVDVFIASKKVWFYKNSRRNIF
jgi:mRNA capping enzyme